MYKFVSYLYCWQSDVEMSSVDNDGVIQYKPDPAKQQSLQSEVIPDPMEGEQTWPTEEELRDASETSYY